MKFRTTVDIPVASFSVEPMERMLFVGSCFADNMGKRFAEERFDTVINPYGVMYNPISILHTVERLATEAKPFTTAVFTLGTNHVYIEKSTGKVVDNCQKRPQRLFEERELTIDECTDALLSAVTLLRSANPQVRVIVTVSPIRYAKYGFHESQLSKATLLLAVKHLASHSTNGSPLLYFPAYEIVLDELRDYRFYQQDMLHPSQQAVDYIYERFADTFFSKSTRQFIEEWRPVKEALTHRPFHPDSDEYKAFLRKTQERINALKEKYPTLSLPSLPVSL